MVKSGKSFVKIGSRLQIALFFLFYRNLNPPYPFSVHSNFPAYLILHNFLTTHILKPKMFLYLSLTNASYILTTGIYNSYIDFGLQI